jgi:hypothetical protein
MRLAFAVFSALLVSVSGCALRPRYTDFIAAKADGGEKQLRVVDATSGAPVAGAKVELGEGKLKLSRVTGTDGTFTLPIDKRYGADNPVLVVTLPAGVTTYRVEAVAPPPSAPAPPAEAAESNG